MLTPAYLWSNLLSQFINIKQAKAQKTINKCFLEKWFLELEPKLFFNLSTSNFTIGIFSFFFLDRVTSVIKFDLNIKYEK